MWENVLSCLNTFFLVGCFFLKNLLPITVQSIGMLCWWFFFQICGHPPEISWTPIVCKTFEHIDSFHSYVECIHLYVEHWRTLPSSTSNANLSYMYIVSRTLIMPLNAKCMCNTVCMVNHFHAQVYNYTNIFLWETFIFL